MCLFVTVGVEGTAGDVIGTCGTASGLPLAQTRLSACYRLSAVLAGPGTGLVLIPRFGAQRK